MPRSVSLTKRITRIRNNSRVPIQWVPKKHINGRHGELVQHLVFVIPPGGYVDVQYKDYCSISGTTIVVHLYPKILNAGGERVFPQIINCGIDIYPNGVDVGDVECTLIADEIRDKLEIRLEYSDGGNVNYKSDKRNLPGGIRKKYKKSDDNVCGTNRVIVADRACNPYDVVWCEI